MVYLAISIGAFVLSIAALWFSILVWMDSRDARRKVAEVNLTLYQAMKVLDDRWQRSLRKEEE